MRFIAIEASFGFQGRYWEKGQIVDLPKGSKPPIHFQALEEIQGEVSEGEAISPPSSEAKPLEESQEGNSEGAPAPHGPGKPRNKGNKPPKPAAT